VDSGTECILSKFADGTKLDDTKLGGVADIPGVCAAIQRDLNRLENGAERNLMQLNKVLHLGVNNLHATVHTDSMESSSAEKDLGV